MSYRTENRGGKTVDQSTDWSNWGWDEANSQWYRTRYDADGTIEYDNVPVASDRDEAGIPRIVETGIDPIPYPPIANTNIVPYQSYYDNDVYAYNPISGDTDSLTSSFRRTTISSLEPSARSQTSYPSTSSEARPYQASAATTTYGQGQSNYSSDFYAATLEAGPSLIESSESKPNQQPSSGVDFGGRNKVDPSNIHKNITETGGDDKPLDPRFKVHNSKYFKPGHVFKVLWSEPWGEGSSSATDVTTFTLGQTKHGEKVHSTIRRFIIVAGDRGHCQCLPILTYGGQGARKWGVDPKDHAIIYTGERAPPEIKGGEGLTKRPIQMIPRTARDKLEPESRINYAKIYTVEHNVKVCFIGHVAQSMEGRLMTDFDNTWNKKRQLSGGFSGYE